MSTGIKKSLVRSVAESAIQSAWVQWRSLGSRIAAPRPARSMVDPEALVLVSLALRDHERRLWDVLASWAASGSSLLSVQRIKNLTPAYPKRTAVHLAEFARMALMEGGDQRWRRLAGTGSAPRPRKVDLRSPDSRSWDSAALMVRLRLGIGVGLQADVLAFLLAQQGAWASARALTEATGYSVYAIRRAADKMAGARLIESTRAKPVEYRADGRAWKAILGLEDDVAPWRYWHQAYAFAANLSALAEERALEAPTPYLLASCLRDLTEKHQDALRLNRIQSPEVRQSTGEEYVAAFERVLVALAAWMRDAA